MASEEKSIGITVTKAADTASWYEQVCIKSELVDFGEIKGTMVIRPKGFYIWEQIQKSLNEKIAAIGVDNASFPMLIPERFFKLEAEHAEGFAPELAWVQAGNMEPGEDKAIIRPTSETIIADQFRKWLRNYKQLPIKVNQWCNIIRWETKQTKLFLRSREFQWQEGHCIYETKEQCVQDVLKVLQFYVDVCKDVLALPLLTGPKTDAEKFAGAETTYAIEAIMPDGKGLQAGTSHYLGQGFMKAFNVKFKGSDEQEHYPHYNSWGISTRLLGATIMTHSDDKGLILPPNAVKTKVVIIPIRRKEMPAGFDAYIAKVSSELSSFGAKVDDRTDYSMGFKLNEYELQGAPLLILIGGKEMEQGIVTLKYRDLADKTQVSSNNIYDTVKAGFAAMHTRLYEKAKAFMESRIVTANTLTEVDAATADGKIAKAFFCAEKDTEKILAETHDFSTRCIDMHNTAEGTCIVTGKKTKNLVYFGRSY
ncbi:MAG TPA: proline--tRNA ligase [Acidobacteriota bacterium]|nr:proline--tRNA ligase [Acidobacteriota bacterium]